MQPAWRRWPGAALLTLAATGGAGVAGLLTRFDPRLTPWFPRCVFHELTGCLCPGCGATRALHALLHADLAGALRDNALLVLALPALLVLVGSETLLPPVRRPFVPARAIWTLLAVIVTFTLARNVPLYPFTLLAPSP